MDLRALLFSNVIDEMLLLSFCFTGSRCVDLRQQMSDSNTSHEKRDRGPAGVTYAKLWALDTQTLTWRYLCGREGISSCLEGAMRAALTEERRAGERCQREKNKGMSLGSPRPVPLQGYQSTIILPTLPHCILVSIELSFDLT